MDERDFPEEVKQVIQEEVEKKVEKKIDERVEERVKEELKIIEKQKSRGNSFAAGEDSGEKGNANISRRGFLKGLGALGVGAVAMSSPVASKMTVSSSTIEKDGTDIWQGGLFNTDNYLALDGSNAMTGNLSLGGNNIANVGTVDSVDVGGHVNSTSNPHSVGLEQVRSQDNVLSGDIDLGGNALTSGSGAVEIENADLDMKGGEVIRKGGERWSAGNRPQKTEYFSIEANNGPDRTVDQNVELCQISRDTDDSSGYASWGGGGGIVEVTIRNSYYRDGSILRAAVCVSHNEHGKNNLHIIESFGEKVPNLHLGDEVDTGVQGGSSDSTVKYSPLYMNVGSYEHYNVEIKYSHTRLSSSETFDSRGQIKFPMNWSTGSKGDNSFDPGHEVTLEKRTDDPSGSNGRMWLRTDL